MRAFYDLLSATDPEVFATLAGEENRHDVTHVRCGHRDLIGKPVQRGAQTADDMRHFSRWR